MSRTLRTLALAVVATLALSGCLRMEMSFTLHEDDTVDGAMLIAIEKGVGEAMGMSDEDLLSELDAESGLDGVDGATVEPYDDGDYVGQTITFENQPLDATDAVDSGLTITREGDEFIVTGEGASAEDLEQMGELPGAVITMSVTFPGEVTEHNGTLEGTTVTWDMLDSPAELSARGGATVGGGGLPTALWVAIGAVVIAAVAVGVVVALRRRGGDAPAEDAAATAEGAPVAPVEPEASAFAPAPVADEAAADEAADEPAPAGEAAAEEPAPATEPIAPTVELPAAADTIETGSVEGTDPEEDHAR
ncbi:LppM family (lipo)protein [Demequina iriomotensis]|uniref:LppM family (lipo)protein n=1 Tax=Demequina iriomotensis TaxID=1536641 RepID=UPI00078361E4|nr:hypothetical protein [Demequina iriomotensis]